MMKILNRRRYVRCNNFMNALFVPTAGMSEMRRFNLPLLEKRISAMNPRVLDSNAWILGFENKTFGFGDTNTYAHT